MEKRLSLNGVSKRFGALQVLNRISLHVDKGEFVSILGPSGAGKSTLFQIFTGAFRQDEGLISFDGEPLEAATEKFSFMPQRDALMPWRTIMNNAILGLEVQGVKRAEARKRAAPLMKEFGLEGFDDHYPHQLSGGMRQRVALLRTVIQQRKMLLLDEPFGALDALTRASMQRWLERMWEEHRWTALLITHDIREAIFLSDRIYVLSNRPAEVALELEVHLPRPRNFQDLNSPEAAELETKLVSALLGPDTEADETAHPAAKTTK